MKKLICTVYDSAAAAFLDPFFCNTQEEAIRMFRSTVMNPDHQFHKFPEDYTLFELGSFDVTTGKVEALATPHSLGLAVTYLPQASNLKVHNG